MTSTTDPYGRIADLEAELRELEDTIARCPPMGVPHDGCADPDHAAMTARIRALEAELEVAATRDELATAGRLDQIASQRGHRLGAESDRLQEEIEVARASATGDRALIPRLQAARAARRARDAARPTHHEGEAPLPPTLVAPPESSGSRVLKIVAVQAVIKLLRAFSGLHAVTVIGVALGTVIYGSRRAPPGRAYLVGESAIFGTPWQKVRKITFSRGDQLELAIHLGRRVVTFDEQMPGFAAVARMAIAAAQRHEFPVLGTPDQLALPAGDRPAVADEPAPRERRPTPAIRAA